MIQATGQFVPVKLDTDGAGKEVAARYGVRSLPTILFVTPSGEVVDRIVGYGGLDAFATSLEQVAAKAAEVTALRSRVRRNPRDLEATARLAALTAEGGNPAEGVALLRQVEQADPENRTGHLTTAYRGVARGYQGTGEFDQAVPLFLKMAETARSPEDASFARMSAAVTLLQMDRYREARAELKAVLDTPGAPKEHRQAARQFLPDVEKALRKQEKAAAGGAAGP